MTSCVLVVDDHALLAHSLSTALRGQEIDARSLRPSSLDEVLETTADLGPGLVLLDLDLGKAGNALPAIRPLQELGARVLVVSASEDAAEIGACLEAGSVGFVSKTNPLPSVRESILQVLVGNDPMTEQERLHYLTALWEQRGRELEAACAFQRLSAREEEVLHDLCEGRNVQAIAGTSYVSVPTVRTQVRAILTKLDVNSQLEAVALGHRSGWHVMREARRAS